MIAVSIQPSSHPGRSGFPSPVGGGSFSHDAPSCRSGRLKCLVHIRPSPAARYQRRFAARWRIHVFPALCPGVSPRRSLCPPRVPLRKHGITALAPRSRHGSAGVTPPSSLLRTHAPDRHPPVGFGCPYSSRSLQVVPSPCCTTALPDVISAILVESSGSVPRHGSAVHSSVSSRGASASPKGQRTRPVRCSRNAVLRGGEFRGCNHSLMFRLPILAWPSDCSDRQASAFRPPGLIHRAVSTAVTGRELRHRYVSESGQLTRQDLFGLPPSLTCWIAALSAAPDPISQRRLAGRVRCYLKRLHVRGLPRRNPHSRHWRVTVNGHSFMAWLSNTTMKSISTHRQL